MITVGLVKRLKAWARAVKTSADDCPGWKKDLAMIQCHESDLPEAAEKGMLPAGTLEYATEIIELNIKGKLVRKTRYQWAQFQGSPGSLGHYPYRSYDTNKTKGILIHKALLDLVALNQACPELSLDELYRVIADRYWK